MESIKVESKDFHKAIHAFRTLFKKNPTIKTCPRFDDEEGSGVFGSCLVVAVAKTKVVFECDDTCYKAYIKDIEYFWFS